MARYQSPDVRCLVFTYKEGLLSKVAHDLRIEAREAWVEADERGGEVHAEIDASSLRVVTAMKAGQPTSALSSSDKAKIEETIRADVLDSGRHGRIVFEGHASVRGERAAVEGTLTLHGSTRPLRFDARRDGGRWVARVRLQQPDYGIAPFKAMMGTLKVKPEVDVEVSIPAG